MRRVALVSPGWPLRDFPNGIVTYVTHLRAGLESIGIDTSVIARKVAPDLDDPSVIGMDEARTVLHRLEERARTRLDPASAPWMAAAKIITSAVRTLERRAPIDVIELEESFGIPAHMRASRPATVVRLHGPWFIVGESLGVPPDEAFRSRVEHERRGLMHARVVSAPSAYVLDRVRAYYGLELPGATVIPNPVPSVPLADRWVDEAAEPESLLFVGRFDRVKGADVLLRAFRVLAAKRPRAKLVFAGPDVGILENGRSVDLATFIERELPAETRARVEVLGPVPANALGLLRRRCAISVVPSRYETFPMTALEGLAHGCPVIASNAGGIPEIVRDGENGLLVPPDDSNALASAMDRLLDDAPLRRRLAAAGPADCAARFEPAIVARSMLELYTRAVAAGPQSVTGL